MVHGPHGITPHHSGGMMGMPPPPFGFPYLGGFPDFNSSKHTSEEKAAQVPLHYQTTFGSAAR